MKNKLKFIIPIIIFLTLWLFFQPKIIDKETAVYFGGSRIVLANRLAYVVKKPQVNDVTVLEDSGRFNDKNKVERLGILFNVAKACPEPKKGEVPYTGCFEEGTMFFALKSTPDDERAWDIFDISEVRGKVIWPKYMYKTDNPDDLWPNLN